MSIIFESNAQPIKKSQIYQLYLKKEIFVKEDKEYHSHTDTPLLRELFILLRAGSQCRRVMGQLLGFTVIFWNLQSGLTSVHQEMKNLRKDRQKMTENPKEFIFLVLTGSSELSSAGRRAANE